MIDLHERLSEFSYGYGVTREAEAALASVGVTATPFLPSLIHENELGFDVAFDRPGAVLLLQFKLGQQMKRYRSVPPGQAAPTLTSPFWRFNLDTTEAQFRLLLDAEQRGGAEVYYVAPRFSHWREYNDAYQGGTVLDQSLMVTPGDIKRELVSHGQPDGRHRVVYDQHNRYLCSEPIPLREARTADVTTQILKELRHKPRRLGDLVTRLAQTRDLGRITDAARINRRQSIQARARSPQDAAAAIFAVEAWSVGAQAIFVTDPEPFAKV